MEESEEEQRRQKLQAGREKLAHFRQRKTKGDGSKAQKKAQKRKNKAVRTNDISKEESALVKSEYAERDSVPGAGDITTASMNSSLDVSEWQDKMVDFEDGLELAPDDAGSFAEAFLEPQLPTEDGLSTDLLHKVVETAVRDRDEIITQLSSNLQEALLSREEVAKEAQGLSSQIQVIQSQLHNANKILMSKSPGKTELHEAEQQFSLLQSSLWNQTERMSQLDQRAQELEKELENSEKENENKVTKLEDLLQEQQSRLEFLHEKLEKSESSVSFLQQELSERNQEVAQLKCLISVSVQPEFSSTGDSRGGGDPTPKANEMDAESLAALVVVLKERLAESETLRESLRMKIEEQMQSFEAERSSWEQKHNEMVDNLTLKLHQAEEIAAQDKHEKDRLNQELRDIKNNLRLEAESSEALKLKYERDLQVYDMKLQRLEEHKTKLDQKSQDTEDSCYEDKVGISITDQDARIDDFRLELEDLKKNLSKVKARKELENSKAVLLHKAEDEDYVATPAMTSLDKYLIPSLPHQMLQPSQSLEDLSEHSKFELDSDFILEQSLSSTIEGNINLFSSPMPITGVLAGGANFGTLLDPESFAVYLSSNIEPSEHPELAEDLVQRCTALMEQIQDKEQHLQKSSEALEEALQKWRDVTAELVATKLELEKASKKEDWEEQRMLEEIKFERDDLRRRIMDQEQLLRETQEKKLMNEEFFPLLAEQKATIERELGKTLELYKDLEIRHLDLGQKLQNSEMARESERQEFDNKLNSKGVEQQLLQESIRAKEAEFYQKEENLREEVCLLRQVKEDLESKLQEEVHRLNAEFQKNMEVSGESWREQIAVLNQEHESKITLLKGSHEREIQKLCSGLKSEREELEELKQQLESAHSMEAEQIRSAHNMEMEAMRLSLNNMHAAHLELSQANLLKEKEDALIQLQEQLNDKWAQDLAILQSKSQFEAEHLREGHRQVVENLRGELSKEISQLQEEHLKEIDLLKEKHVADILELDGRHREEVKTYEEEKLASKKKQEILRDDLAQKLETKSEELKLVEEESLAKLSNLMELHAVEKNQMLSLHLEEREQWELKQDTLSQELRDALKESELHRKEMLHLEELNDKASITLKETLSKHCEEMERVQEEHLNALKQNEELSRQMEFLSEEHAMKISEVQQQYKKEIEILEQAHFEKRDNAVQENQHSELLEQLGKELSQMAELHSSQTDQLLQKHSTELLHFQNIHSRELTELQGLLTLEKHGWTMQQEEDAKKLLELQTPWENMNALQIAYLQDKKEWEKQMEEQSEILKRLNEEIANLQDEHVKAVKQLQEQHIKEIRELQEQLILENEEWEKERDQHSQELDVLVNQHSQELKHIGEDLLQDSLLKQEEHSRQLEKIREECVKQILALQQQHLIEIQKMGVSVQKSGQWENEGEQHFQQLHSTESLWQNDSDPQEFKCTHEMLEHICLLKDSCAKENIVLEQRGQMHNVANLDSQKDTKLMDQDLEALQVHGEQTGAVQEHHEQTSESSHLPHIVNTALISDSDYDQTPLIPLQQQNETGSDSVTQKELRQSNTLQISYSEAKIESSEEIRLLWSQIDRSRASRQELSELKDQLIARSTQLEEIERMRKDFEQERLLLKAQHEKELEELRIYFEQKSSSAEETYREELKILQQRFREMSDDKGDMTLQNCSSVTLEESFESDKLHLLQHLTDQLELHKEELSYSQLHVEERHKLELENLQAVLSLQYKEDVLNLKLDLSEKYTSEIETLKRRHCLELEQLRAKLSEKHIRDIRRLQLNTSEALQHGANTETPALSHRRQNVDAEPPQNEDGTISELPFSDDHIALKQLEKNTKTVQTDLGSESDGGKQGDGEAQLSQLELLQALHATELADTREKMASDLEEFTRRLQVERENALMEAESRIAEIRKENTKLQKDLLREKLRAASVEYKEVGNDLNFQPEDNLLSCVAEEKHNEGLGDGGVPLKGPDAKTTVHLSELCAVGDLNACLSELQSHHQKEVYTVLSKLLQRHQAELHTCTLNHEAHIQSLEASHLVKLDTLESSYLTEIQKIRDEHALALEELEKCLYSKLREKEKEVQQQLETSRAQWLQQQEQEMQRLRQELAAVHLEKFEAMAEELEDAHSEDLRQRLDQQLFQLEEVKKQALDVLQEEVVRMEAQNQLNLQELHELHRGEVEQQTRKLVAEKEQMTEELHKQELFVAELSREREALTTELQRASDQQRHFQEEIELLKCQSEMLLEQQITLLKDEFSAEKRSALQELEERFSRELEKVRAEQQMEKDHLMKQMEDKNTEVIQLQDKVSDLTKEMDVSQSRMDELVQRRERENQEGEHLVAMLQSDTQTAQQEQKKLQDSCQRLLKLFADILKNTLVTEDLISKKIGLCLDNSLPQTDDERMDNLAKSSDKTRLSPDCETMTENSLMSTDEGYELSEYLCDSVLGSLEVGLENEEKIVRMGHRLRAAVERLLDMVTDSNLQLEQTRSMQKCFEEEFTSRNQDMAQVVIKNQDLLKQLTKESEDKNQLQVELHKLQGLIEGFALEKATLEEALLSKENSEHQLIVELEKSREQLKILTQEPSVSGKEKEVLQRLQEVLSGSDIEADLLKETEHLLKEELELHCQAKQDRLNLISQMKMLEMELEEQMARNQELMKKTSEMIDLKQQIQSLEKQLKSQRHFMDEQAVEREHERDEFQQEIQNLEEQLKQALKSHGDSKAYGIETLEAQVKEKADDNKILLQGREQLEQQVVERNEEIDKMLLRIQELEQAALSNADAAKNCGLLEAELQKMQKMQKELEEDKEALQQQQYNNVLQISALQSKLDETRHRLPVDGEPDHLLKQELQAEREALQRKEKETESLAEQLEQFREELMNKTEEVFQLNLQLDIQRKQYEQAVQQSQEAYLQLKDEMSAMQSQHAAGASSTLQLPQALLQEKNQEIDHLNEQILRLQQQATCTESVEVEELRSLVELLRSDLDRLRKDKEEEVEQLHEVIEKLQQELEQLGPNRHEISDSQESLDQLGLGEVENLRRELRKGAQQLQGGSTTPARLEDPEASYTAELESLQHKLEESESLHITEVEVLERNLLNLQESGRQQEQALETLLIQHGNLQEERDLLHSRLSEREAQIVNFSSRLQELQDRLRETDGFLMEKELLVQTLQEQNVGDRAEFENQLALSAQSLEAAKMDFQREQEQRISLQDLMVRCSNEQRESEEESKREIQDLKQLLSHWEKKAQIITGEMQTQTEDEYMESQAVTNLVILREQLNNAENLARLRETDFHNAQEELSNMKIELEELRVECEQREAKAQDVIQQLQKRETRVADLQTHSQNLGTQVKKLHDALVNQEAMIALMSGGLPQRNLEDLSHKPDLSRPVKEGSFSESLTDLSSWDSPEMVRKQEEAMHSLRTLTPFSDLSIDPSAELMRSKSSCLKRPEHGDLLGSSTPSLSESNFSTQRASPLRDTGDTNYGSCDDLRSSRDDQIDQMDSEKFDDLDYRPEVGKSELNYMENLLRIKQSMSSSRTTGLSPQLQSMLNLVHEESCNILELSERPLVKAALPDSSDLAFKIDTWQKEKQSLQETIQSLSSALAHAADKGDKESSTLDWRRDLLQSVQALLESEREYLRLELQSDIRHGAGEKGLLSEKVEQIIKQQEEQKRLVLEHVLAVDRSSLLSEIQDLRSQLRMAHLQNQEKLQKLQDTLTSTEQKGHRREHQLRRQVELLEYKLQQEASIGEDLKGSLSREKERATEQYKLLLQEQATISNLRNELEEKALEIESLRRSLKELQKEIQMETSRLRDELENKEKAMSDYIKTIQTESQVEKRRFNEERSLIQRNLDIKEKSLQEASLSLEEHKSLNSKMSATLSQEQVLSDNLKKELVIEQSRCKALLAQEHSKLSEAAKELEKEKQHTSSLSNALTLEHSVLKQLKQQSARELAQKEEERQREHKLALALQNELEDERKRARDLAAMMEKTQQQAVHAKRQLESEVQAGHEEVQKEQEAGVKLRAQLESLQSQRRELDGVLDQQRERELRLQKERDQYQAQVLILQEKERTSVKESEQESKRVRHAEASRVREEEQHRQIMDLQLQHERDKRRIQELQQMLADLEEQERALASRKSRLWNDSSTSPNNVAYLTTNLQRVWQQLLRTVLQLKKWTQNKNDGKQEFPDEAEVTMFLHSLSELKSELQKGYVQQPEQSPSSMIDVLKRENEELSGSVSHLTKEKLELKSQLSKLARSHQELLQKTKDQVNSADIDSALEAERAVWLREKRLLQIALKHAESELGKATLENRPLQDVPNSKIQRLYRKYLKAESFRKALVYQKKYLLLLLGGFQACEKATLSLIARMGAYPSPADVQNPSKCRTALSKFRSAVRAVIAISRLKFLVRKWHKINRKGSDEYSGIRQVPVNRMDVLQPLVRTTLNSPPNRDLSFNLYRSPNTSVGTISLKPSQWTPKGAEHSSAHTPERSHHSSQNPEHSITDYIQHLEMVQRRLGGLQNNPSAEQPHCGKYGWK